MSGASSSSQTSAASFGKDGRYVLAREIASGGMASVHLALQRGGAGFNRVVAVKRLRSNLTDDSEFFSMMMDEGRLGSRVQHSNVVAILDVEEVGNEIFLVFEYVHGESLARLLKLARDSGRPIPPPITAALLVGALRGLHHAHHAVGADGAPLGLVHRDISPQNILVDVTGTAKVADFGIAKAEGRMQHTEFGQVKGKIAYMAPEQLYGKATQRSDVFSMGVVAWEMFASRRLFAGKTRNETAQAVLELEIPTLGSLGVNLPEGVERVVMSALEREPLRRPASALEMAARIEAEMQLASPSDVGAWVREAGGEALRDREREIHELENSPWTRTSSAETPAAVRPTAAPSRRWGGIVILLVGIGAALSLGIVLGRGAPKDAFPQVVASEPVLAREAPMPSASSDESTPPPGASAEAVRDAGPVRAGSARRSAPRKSSCSPPTYVDAKGVKRYKPECF